MSELPKQILMGVTGSIAAFKSADMIRRLQDRGCDVTVIMTREAEHFITPLTLASLSGNPVYREMFDDREGDWQMHHIQLAKKSDALLIAPATANIIGKLACGLADDLLTCAVLAMRAPVIIAPAMNDGMYNNSLVQRNCQTLKDQGFHFIDPVAGNLACGDYGEGHLADVDQIVDDVIRIVAPSGV